MQLENALPRHSADDVCGSARLGRHALPPPGEQARRGCRLPRPRARRLARALRARAASTAALYARLGRGDGRETHAGTGHPSPACNRPSEARGGRRAPVPAAPWPLAKHCGILTGRRPPDPRQEGRRPSRCTVAVAGAGASPAPSHFTGPLVRVQSEMATLSTHGRRRLRHRSARPFRRRERARPTLTGAAIGRRRRRSPALSSIRRCSAGAPRNWRAAPNGAAHQASTEGAPIPRLYGRVRLAGQVIWASQFEEDGWSRARAAAARAAARRLGDDDAVPLLSPTSRSACARARSAASAASGPTAA